MKKKNQKTRTEIVWFEEPQEHDYPAAMSYLTLIYSPALAKKMVAKLRRASMTQFHAKDIFRTAGLALLGPENYHVKKVHGKISDGHEISPLLLVRSEPHGKVVVADGYHRICAVYSFDEDAVVPCKIV